MMLRQTTTGIIKVGLFLLAGLLSLSMAMGQAFLETPAQHGPAADVGTGTLPAFAMAPCVPGTVNRFTGSYHSNLYIGNASGENVLLAWGQNMKTYTTGVGGDYTAPFFVNASSYAGIPYEVRSSSTGGGTGPSVMALRTSTKFYVFGNVFNIAAITTMANFGAAALTNSNADVSNKLPAGLGVADIAQFALSPSAIGIVTKAGNVYMLTQIQSLQGDNAAAGPAVWHQVKLSNGTALSGVVKFSLSGSGAFALTATGKIHYWGKPANVNGTVNTSTSYNYAYDLSAQIPAGTSVVELEVLGKDTGPSDLFLLCNDLKVYACGLNTDGVLGMGNANTSFNQATFQQVSGLSDIVHIDGNTEASLFTMGAMSGTGRIYGWGDGVACMLGIAAQSSCTSSYTNAAPIDIFGVDGFRDFSISGHFTMAFFTNPVTAVDQYWYVGHNTGGSIGIPSITSVVIGKTAIARLDAPTPIGFNCSNTHPTMDVEESVTAFKACMGAVSANQVITVAGSHLISDLTIHAPAGFEIATSAVTGFDSMLRLSPTGAAIAATKIYIRMAAASTGTVFGNLVFGATGASTKNLAMTGMVNSLPIIASVTGATRSGPGSVMLSGTVTPSVGSSIDWFAAATGGLALREGTLDYATGTLDRTTTFFLEARDLATGCVSASRVPVIATVNESFNPGVISTDQSFCKGVAALPIGSITDASGGTGTFGYQWQVSTTSADSGFTDIPGANRSTFSPGILPQTSFFRRVASTLADGRVYSNVVGIVIHPIPNPATAVHGSRTGAGIVSIGAVVAADETADWYQWASGGTVLSGGKGTTSFMTPSIDSTTNFYAIARNAGTGCEAATRSLVVASIVAPVPVIAVYGNLNAFHTCSNKVSAEQFFTVSAEHLVDNLLIQSPVGYEISRVSGSDFSSSIALIPLAGSIPETTIYTRLAKTASNGITGNIQMSSTHATTHTIATGTATVSALSNAGIIAGADSVCAGINSANLVLTGNIGRVIQWQSSPDAEFGTSTDLSNASNAQMLSNLTNSRYYRAIVQNGYCPPAITDPVLIAVHPSPVFSLGMIPEISTAASSFAIPLTVSHANQFSISEGSRAMAGFKAISNGAISGTMLSIPIPASLPGQYDFNLSVSNAVTGCKSALSPIVLNVVKQAPTIRLSNISKTIADPDFSIAASSNSTGAISYSVDHPAIATITGNTVHLLSPGSVTITASQTPDAHYLPGSTTAFLTIADQAPSGLSYPGPNLFPIQRTIAALTPSVSGNVTFYRISPLLPAGLDFNESTGVISGTPTAASVTTIYTVTAGNTAGMASATVSIGVSKLVPMIAMNNVVKILGDPDFTVAAMSNSPGTISYRVHHPSIARITGNLVNLVSSGMDTITAIQEATPVYEAATVSAQLMVYPMPKIELEYPPLNRLTIGQLIQPIKPMVQGNLSGFRISPELPNGLSLDATNGFIYGTTTAITQPTEYRVTATDGRQTIQANLLIQVNDLSPMFHYQPDTAMANPRFSIHPAIPQSSGGKVISYSVNPALPLGLRLDEQTGLIWGQLTTVRNGSEQYHVTGANSGGVCTAQFRITFNSAPTDLLLNKVEVLENQSIGTPIGELKALDPDVGDQAMFQLVTGLNGNDNPFFEIKNNSLSAKAVFDFEQKDTYHIRVRATDEGGLYVERTFVIKVIDVNEVPTLAVMKDIRVYNLTSMQTVTLSDLSAGADQNQSLAVQVTTNKPHLFEAINVIGNQLLFTLKPNVFGNDVLVRVLVKDNGGVLNGGMDSIERSFLLGIDALPTVTAFPEQVSLGKTIQLQVEAANAVEYHWNNLTAMVAGNFTRNPVVRPMQDDLFRVSVKNKWGYAAEGSVKVRVIMDYAIVPSNLLSPNGDGHNDCWIIANIEGYPDNEVAVYDKTGKLVYQEKGYSNHWDGKVNGLPLKEDVYFYIIQFNKPNVIPVKGYLTIIH